MESSDDLIAISELEHWSYCPRQCGLIRVEQTFTDNVYTVRGQIAHERTHQEETRVEEGITVVRGMALWSYTLGLTGKADVVEFHGARPYPVEYKVGKVSRWGHANIQLGAQAMCLEEMLEVPVPEGALFFRGSQRRTVVAIDRELRATVRSSIAGIRAMLAHASLPPALNDRRCPTCSLFDACLPSVVAGKRRLQLLHTELFRAETED